MAMQQQQPWRASYCGFFDDCESCCLGCLCPCVQYGKNVERLTQGEASCCGNCCLYYLCLQVGCCCLVAGPRRTQLRAKYGLAEDCANDCCATCICPCCAMTQEWREMNVRGPPPVMTMGSPVVVTQQVPGQQIMMPPTQGQANYQSGQASTY